MKNASNTYINTKSKYAINQNFETYNYNASYSTDKYTFSPPINVDKFLNFKNYRWVEEMPVYESVYTGTSKNPLIDSLSVRHFN